VSKYVILKEDKQTLILEWKTNNTIFRTR